MTSGLEGLQGLVLETILSKLGARDVAAVACANTRLLACASNDALWRRLYARDFALDPASAPLDPDGNVCPSFKVAYQVWFESFGMYPLPLVRRVKQFWGVIKGWLAQNFPEARRTLRKGASEAELKQAEDTLKVKFPVATRVLYRFCDGQDTALNEHLAYFGIIGGYEFYNHVVNVHFLPLSQMVFETRDFYSRQGFKVRSKYVIVAASYYLEKWFFLNCGNGQLYVGTANCILDGEMLPCVPLGLVRPWPNMIYDMPQDGLLLWLEEHCRRLQSGMIRTRAVGKYRAISLYPEAPPPCSTATTNGVQVRASAVLVPEATDLSRGGEYLFSYSIRISLLPEECILDGTYYGSCQLYSRHWIIRSNDDVVLDLNGEAVIGKFPLLFPNKEEFVYESCTPLQSASGSIEGSFTFVPGRLRNPEGRQFDVKVSKFILEVPEYIF